MKCLLASFSRLLAAATLTASVSTVLAIPVWINEIHYDNAGADAGEFVEIAGSSGTSLSGYTLLFYNGNGGTTYKSVALSGAIDDESNGFGTLSFSISGIQNGDPDGLALIDSANTVLQFLSYEGSFTATNGAADTMTSIDIGVSEPASSPASQSLQLTGSGSEYSDFTWTGPSAESPGTINVDQSFVGKTVPDSGSSAFLLLLGISGLTLVTRKRRSLS